MSYSQIDNMLNLNKEISFSLNTNENKLIVNANIPKGYYAYLESSIANKIKFYADDKEINVVYPKGEVYHNDIIIKESQEFILNDINLNNIKFIKVSYQLCSEADNICLPPRSEVIYGEESANETNSKPENASLIEKNYISDNMFITLILIFAAGLASVLLPCTYPLISITVSVFAGDKNNKSNVFAPLLFCLGIITAYTILGAIVSVAGFAFNKTILFGSVGYNPIVLSVLVLLFLYFTFSMAGFYEIQAPAFLRSAKTETYAKKNKSVFHKYIMGLLSGIVATPCAAPIIAIILEIGFLNPAFSTIYMAVYALGFSSVMFILGTFASILVKIPKSGNWTILVKYVFVFLMLLISFYYADILFGVLGFDKISYLAAATFITAFSILIYFIKRKALTLTLFEKKIFLFVLILSLILGCSYGFLKSQSKIYDGITFEEALELSKKNKKYILIDFSAVWCANCYELKEKVLNDAELKKIIDENLILIEVDVDKRKDLADRFEIKWLPWIIIIDENKNIVYTKNSFESFGSKTALSIKKDIESIMAKK